jgi:hypothetical protein
LVDAGRSPEELAWEFEPPAQSIRIRNWHAQSARDPPSWPPALSERPIQTDHGRFGTPKVISRLVWMIQASASDMSRKSGMSLGRPPGFVISTHTRPSRCRITRNFVSPMVPA